MRDISSPVGSGCVSRFCGGLEKPAQTPQNEAGLEADTVMLFHPGHQWTELSPAFSQPQLTPLALSTRESTDPQEGGRSLLLTLQPPRERIHRPGSQLVSLQAWKGCACDQRGSGGAVAPRQLLLHQKTHMLKVFSINTHLCQF